MIRAIKAIFSFFGECIAFFFLKTLDLLMTIFVRFGINFIRIFERMGSFISLEGYSTPLKVFRVFYIIIFFIPCLALSLAEFIVRFPIETALAIINKLIEWIPVLGFLVAAVSGLIEYVLGLIFNLLFVCFLWLDAFSNNESGIRLDAFSNNESGITAERSDVTISTNSDSSRFQIGIKNRPSNGQKK